MRFDKRPDVLTYKGHEVRVVAPSADARLDRDSPWVAVTGSFPLSDAEH
jgi:hypothetical protein